jgi:ribosomal protein L37AE/L43A
MEGTELERDQEIRRIAYSLWECEGCPNGRDVQHWLKAQMIWEETNRPQPKAIAKRSKAPTRKKAKQLETADEAL